MEPWKLWLEMALESEAAARACDEAGHLRPAISRYYYAAYQAVTAVLRYRKQIPPPKREAWSHEETPQMLREHLKPVVPSRDTRNDLAHRLAMLYKARVTADYVSQEPMTTLALNEARRDAGHIIKSMRYIILPKEPS
jgi:uncharacterized protein (UPF0332 family)